MVAWCTSEMLAEHARGAGESTITSRQLGHSQDERQGHLTSLMLQEIYLTIVSYCLIHVFRSTPSWHINTALATYP